MRMLVLLTVLSLLGHADLRAQLPIQMDGKFDDWRRLGAVAVNDPIGDASGAFDLSHVSTFVAAATVYVHFDTQQPLNLPSGPSDEGTLKLRFELPRGESLLVDLRNRKAEMVSGTGQHVIPWRDLRFASLPTYAAQEFEVQIDLTSAGARPGDQIRLEFLGSDQLAAPISLTIGRSDPKQVAPPKLDCPTGSIRIASLNTLKQGSVSPTRAESLKTLFQFADADVYCFNEAFDEAIFRRNCFNILPERLAGTENLHWSATCGIVSRFPLTPLPFRCKEAAALVELPNDRHLVVVSVHLTCCGHNGSDEDKVRLREAREVLADLQRMRRGEFGAEAAKAGVVALGDFNLVGSRMPLTLFNESGLDDLLLTCPVDGSAMTWRGLTPEEPFWPGRLDYVTVEKGYFQPTGGFIMNSDQLGAIDANLKVEFPASDHSMLVVDLKPQ